MSSITGLKRGTFTSVDNSGEFRLDTNLDPGTAGECITSNGLQQPASWGIPVGHIANALTSGTNVNYTSGNPTWDGSIADTINSTNTTYSDGAGIDLTGTTFSTDNDGTTINNSGAGSTNQVLAVPNDLTAGTNITYSAGTTYDGSSAITINSTDTDTLYYAGAGLGLVGVIFNTDNDGVTIDFAGGTGTQNQVLKVPNDLTAGTNVTFSVGTTYNGSAAITVNSTDTDTTYQGGDNITIDTTTNPDTIDLDAALTGMTGITYSGGGGNNLTGGGGAGGETISTYLDLTSDTNLFPSFSSASVVPYLDVAWYDPATATSQTLSTSFVELFSGLMTLTFICQPGRTLAEVELKVMSYGGSSNKWLYLGLLDGVGTTEWSISMATGGGYGTGTAVTPRLVHYRDESDGQYQTMSWLLSGLTPGNTYIVNPSARTNTTSNYIYAGGRYPSTAFPACVSRVTQL